MLERRARAALEHATVVPATSLVLALGALLADVARTSGTTVICATHDPLLIEQADIELSLASV